MKKIGAMVIICLSLVGSAKSVRGATSQVLTSTASSNSIWSNIFGTWSPKHWIEIGGGYQWNTAAKSEMLYSSATQYDVLFGEQYGQYNQLGNHSEQGLLTSVDVYLTDKIWLEGEYLFGSQEQEWKWTDKYSVPTSWSGKTTFYTSPVVSLNYAPFNIYGFRPYVGVGAEHVSASSNYVFITNGVNYPDPGNSTTVSDGGWNILCRVGIKFPIWERLTGSVDWEGGQGVNANTPLMYTIENPPHNVETIHNTNINTSQFSASLHFVLF